MPLLPALAPWAGLWLFHRVGDIGYGSPPYPPAGELGPSCGCSAGVGRSTTDAVVTALLGVFVTNFLISWLAFQGLGSALSRAL